jgi:hypothetical protein
MNIDFYSKRLIYSIGEVVLYRGKQLKIVHIHDCGLMNLEDGWFYILGCHPHDFYKLNK